MKISCRPSRWTIIFLIITMPILTVVVLMTTNIVTRTTKPYFSCGQEKLCAFVPDFPYVKTFAHGINTKKARDIEGGWVVADDSHVYAHPEWCGLDTATGFDAKTLQTVYLSGDNNIEIILSGGTYTRNSYLQDKNGTYVSTPNGIYGRPKAEHWGGCRFAKVDLTEQLKNMKK